MRTSVAAVMSISVLFVGVFAISESAQQSKQTALGGSQASSNAYNTGVSVFDGVVQGGGTGIVWFGVAAVVIVALGALVFAGSGGGR